MGEKLEGVVLSDSHIYFGSEGGCLAGVRATVETAGDIDRRRWGSRKA